MPETLTDLFVSLIRRKMKFLFFVVGLGAIGIAYAHGWSWTSVLVVTLCVIVLGAFWIISSFWIWVFRNAGRSQEPR